VLLWNGITDMTYLAFTGGVVALMAATSWWMSRRRRVNLTIATLLHAVLIIVLSRFCGPFLFLPALVVIFTMTLISQGELIDRRVRTLAILIGAWALPLVLEATGVIPRTSTVEGGAFVTRSSIVNLDDWHAVVTLAVLITSILLTSGLFARALARTRREAQRRTAIQAWHLRKALAVEAPHVPAEPERGCLV
jgi:hypothetical protein